MFLSQQLMDKAVMVSNDAERNEMLEDLGAENVPRSIGGLSDAGTFPLPAHLRMPPGGWSDVITRWRPRKIVIATRAKHEETVRVPAGGHVRWQWSLLDLSISFEVLRRSSGEFEIVSSRKELSFIGLEDPVCGEAPAPDGGGEIRLVWDNTASMIRTKTLLLRLEVIP